MISHLYKAYKDPLFHFQTDMRVFTRGYAGIVIVSFGILSKTLHTVYIRPMSKGNHVIIGNEGHRYQICSQN